MERLYFCRDSRDVEATVRQREGDDIAGYQGAFVVPEEVVDHTLSIAQDGK